MSEGQGGRLAGKAALITGGAGGIGVATARRFLAEGARVALLDRDPQALAAAAAGLGGGKSVVAVAADIADAAAVGDAVRHAVGALGGLDVLVNNAAARVYQPLAEASAESWDAILGVNVIGASNVTRAALPPLRASGRGAVVNVSSAFALIGRRGMGQYDATKAALVAMTRALAAEEAGSGVRVNAVCPGSILTPYTQGRAAARGMSEAELAATGMAPCLLGRWGTPEEVANPILWLASDEASFITGAVLAVDGGLTGSLTG
jgi:meso-butanediol dehydrogenase/(S,S)-butanediol dehydrogenase/diacetyl reductase